MSTKESLPAIVANGATSLELSNGSREMNGRLCRRILKIEVPDQEGQEWCWAAVAVGIARAYNPRRQHEGRKLEQCQVATQVLRKETPSIVCCGGNIECDRESELDPALEAVGHLRKPLKGPQTWEFIKSEIDHGRPIAVRIDRDGKGHFLVITGYGEFSGARYVYYDDPISRRGVRSVDSFTIREDGIWTNTYTTKGFRARGRQRVPLRFDFDEEVGNDDDARKTS